MLEIKTLAGVEELLSDYRGLTVKEKVNGDRSISFLLPKTDANEHAFVLVDEEAVVTYDGSEYRIKVIEERVVNKTIVKSVVAQRTFFDLVDEFRYETLSSGFKSINTLLSFIFTDTDYTFSVIDTYGTLEFENFGNDNCLALFNKVIERFGVEYELNGNDVIIRNQIGSVIDLQFRYNHNVTTFKKSIDSSNLSTYIEGSGKLDDNGEPIVTATYTSPNAAIFGIRHAPPYSNESITHQETLDAALVKALSDTPTLTIELSFAVLKDAGYLAEKPTLGDIVPTIYEPLNDLDLDLRVMEIEDYPESPRAPEVVLATKKQSYAGAIASYQKSLLDRIYDENSGKLRYNVYSEAVQRATEALNNSLTELEYPEGMGIIARDPNDPLRFVALRSSGLGVTTDGGLTFGEAITADGVTTSLLTAGQIKTNNIQIIGEDDLFYWDGTQLIAIDAVDPTKYVSLDSSGLYAAKGSITIERPDGFKVVDNGMNTFNVNVQGVEPTFHPAGVTLVQKSYAQWLSTRSTTSVDFNQYSFEHTSRYLKVRFRVLASGSNTAHFEIWKDGNLEASAQTSVSDENDPSVLNGSTLTVDLGVPTGNAETFQIRFRSSVSGEDAYAMVSRKWLTL